MDDSTQRTEGSKKVSAGKVDTQAPDHSSPETASSPHRHRLWAWLLGVGVLLALIIVAVVRKPKSTTTSVDTTQPAVANIMASQARLGDMGTYIEALGTVTPLATVNLYSQVNGKVDAVHYVEGQMVRRGDPLIDIDPRPYEAQLLEAQGTLAHDRAVLAQAEMDLARYKDASSQQAIARQTYEDQVHTVDQNRGTVQNDEGQVKYAQVQLSYCHINSPISGRVGLRLVDPGNTVFSGSSTAIVVITQLQPITVVFNVSEDSLGQVHDQILRRKTLPVDVLDRSQMTKIASGKLLTLDNQVDTSTGTVRFRGQFDNDALTLYPNQFVNARLLVKTLRGVVLIPTAAVQRNGAQAFVYIIDNGTAKIRNVTEASTEDNVAAVNGINAGDVVSVTGFDKLLDGSKVNVQGIVPFGNSDNLPNASAKTAGR
ncbi:efflux RND transporter periplasmic adaptor subunit [Tunturibacter empetritectus]|uniref:Efflux RND transporter periplasmic adaptor subunit n=1 Tax=Tunturiibacter empetritectus TaxID=3069691 RepID=A0AAU7ZFU9_9BACT